MTSPNAVTMTTSEQSRSIRRRTDATAPSPAPSSPRTFEGDHTLSALEFAALELAATQSLMSLIRLKDEENHLKMRMPEMANKQCDVYHNNYGNSCRDNPPLPARSITFETACHGNLTKFSALEGNAVLKLWPIASEHKRRLKDCSTHRDGEENCYRCTRHDADLAASYKKGYEKLGCHDFDREVTEPLDEDDAVDLSRQNTAGYDERKDRSQMLPPCPKKIRLNPPKPPPPPPYANERTGTTYSAEPTQRPRAGTQKANEAFAPADPVFPLPTKGLFAISAEGTFPPVAPSLGTPPSLRKRKAGDRDQEGMAKRQKGKGRKTEDGGVAGYGGCVGGGWQGEVTAFAPRCGIAQEEVNNNGPEKDKDKGNNAKRQTRAAAKGKSKGKGKGKAKGW